MINELGSDRQQVCRVKMNKFPKLLLKILAMESYYT